MPGRNNRARGQGGVDAVLRDDMNNYRKALDKMRQAEKLNAERALEHRLLWEKLKKLNPHPTDEDLLAHAQRLEDQGLLSEAADVIQQLLLRPDQFHNKQLRDHLAELVKRVNRRQAEAKVLERAAELEEEGRLWPGRPRGLQSPRERIPGVPRADKPVGPMMPMSPDAYRAELAAQVAMANRRRREEARKQEELLGQKQIAVAAAMEALDQHRRRVGGANDRLSLAVEREEELREREEERRRQFYQEWDRLKPAGGPEVRQSYDLEERRREQVQGVHGHRASVRNSYDVLNQYQDADGYYPRGPGHGEPGGAVAAGPRQRPSSAGAAAAVAVRERERERNNAANFERLYVPVHPYAPAGGPPQRHEAWPTPPAAGSPRPGAVPGGLRGVLKSPYARPDVDKPRVRIDPQVVRGHQQAFIEKHRKPEPPPRQEVPLRVRKEAARRPDPPIIAYGTGGRSAWP
ncbi:hypothetical protein VOLCADRAFT_90739 [Volvox carteri f. nagariensis]|uniref:Uncharacterized protein n=1 Tax=Volvox carteri f. nagariensis TaxID=3068 RepID=D8TVL5_VOLCA|nr:uncharacterized protein VOLCADRAFT_90739 [Volvox carteri f. nagariensis]EFJ48603.1 hypothetical protein VOLCADRAFT_90739 [Volvox carteri f. nagariensis]|eukprot:XP_002950402.1 hypothetical protein VOLCADRAFT_90739 [Volvox carteri f. nagariensis]